MSADVAELRHMAAQAQGLAAEMRAAAHQLQASLGVEFVSRAADRYREAIREEIKRAEHAAHEFDQAAHALQAHAREVEERLAEIARVERWFSDRVHEARNLVAQALDLTDDLVRHGSADAQHVLDRARHAPPPGSPEWLRFTAGMRR